MPNPPVEVTLKPDEDAVFMKTASLGFTNLNRLGIEPNGMFTVSAKAASAAAAALPVTLRG